MMDRLSIKQNNVMSLFRKYIIDNSQWSRCHKNLPFNCQKRMEKNINRGIISIFMFYELMFLCFILFQWFKDSPLLKWQLISNISFWSGWLSVYIKCIHTILSPRSVVFQVKNIWFCIRVIFKWKLYLWYLVYV